MQDGQDHQDGGEIEADVAAMPSAGPSGELMGEAAAADDIHEAAAPDDSDDHTGLTGVLAALEEPEAESIQTEPEALEVAAPPNASEDVHDEIAALQAALDADEPIEAAAETVAEPAAEPDVAASPTPAAEPGVAADPAPEAAAQATAEITPAAAPGEQASPQEPAQPAFFPEDRRAVPIWPFLVYFGLWVVFAGLLVWQFMETPAGVPLYDRALYGPSILAGLVLTALGPLLAIGVWFVVWLARPGARSGLFSRSLILGAVVTLVGVALWLVALGAVDMLRLGRLI